MTMYEILVPTIHRLSQKPVRKRFHKVWDAKVRDITGGLTILSPVRGQWKASCGTLFNDRMIPVRIACTKEQMDRIVEMTAKYYDELAVFYYLVSNETGIYMNPSPKEAKKG